MKYCIAIPSTIDDECISDAVSSYVKNIIKPNITDDIQFIIHVDNFQYSDSVGTLESTIKLYEQLSDYVKCDVYCDGTRLGLKGSYQFLMKKFLDSDCDYLVFYDDDHKIINPMPLSNDFIKSCLGDSKYLIHFANAYLQASSEFPFLTNDSVYANNKIIIRKNSKFFYTQPGTLLPRGVVGRIFNDYCNHPVFSSEKIVGNLITKYYNLEVLTVCVNSGADCVKVTGSEFSIPIEDHFSVDGRRFIKAGGYSDKSVFLFDG